MADNKQNETDNGLAPVKKKKSLSKKLLKAFIILLAVVVVILLGARLYFRIPVHKKGAGAVMLIKSQIKRIYICIIFPG